MNLVIYGISDFAKLMRYYFEMDSNYQVVAFAVDKQWHDRTELDGLPVIQFDAIDDIYSIETCHIFVAAAYKNMRGRMSMYHKAKEKGYRCASYISKQALCDPNVNIGENVIVLAGAILEPFVNVGNNSFINSGVTLCHHSNISPHCFLAARSLVGGYTQVGEGSFIGFGASVLQKLMVANETLVAAGAVVTSNTESSCAYFGIPAVKKRSHERQGICIVDARIE